MISAWLRVMRIRFMLASVISASAGLALAWQQGIAIDPLDAALTFLGVAALHASVDLLNDFWDFKRGIDTNTKRTAMSGGTGVLPDGLLSPSAVYRAGIASLIAGAAIGGYFVYTDGIVIAAILGFAILSIYFYSTKIVDSGLGEIFVAVKGALITIGAYYIQTGSITPESITAGAAIGTLSSLVLFVVSFPDYAADKAKGRKTLVIALGRSRAAGAFWLFPATSYAAILYGAASGLLPATVLISIVAMPLAMKAGLALKRDHSAEGRMMSFMSTTLAFSRVAGALLVAGILAGHAY